ncbi:hypothetical protein GCM10009819_11410 [Agromyces tropicus]|uniref:AbiEi antitoxin C-terminal domain-containing protein n=1 Tax=Agromyces tropicus TaxID=555371 RepID=A0ABP5FMM6_9MICO
MPSPRPLPMPLSIRPFTVAEARAAGVGEGRLRGRDLARPFHGVRVTAAQPLELEARCRARLPLMRGGQVFSHATAIALHRIDLPRRLAPVDVDVAAFVPAAIPRGRGVRGHRLAAGATPVTIVRGWPVIRLEDAWCQLAAQATRRELVIIGDAMLRRHYPASDLDRMHAAVARHRGRRGHRRLVAALGDVRPGTDSVAETELRLDAPDCRNPR